MPEPDLPVPSPEGNDYWDPHPMRCPECRTILQSRGGGMGWCPAHGEAKGVFYFTDETENFQFPEGEK